MHTLKTKYASRLTLYISFFMLLLALLSACDFPGTSQATPTPAPRPVGQCTEQSSNPVTLNMYYGSEKQLWINDVVAEFNSRKMTACDGPITVKATPIGSGDSMQQILAGKIQPDIWSPAGRVWLTLLDSMWLEKYGSHIISTGASDTPPLVNSPVVIAMWKSEAAALGWPDQPIGWAQIDKLSTGGWATLGHPELTARFGDFKFGHTLPDLSNSGLDAVIAEYYAGSGEKHTLNLDDVNNAQTKEFVTNVESSIIYYGDNSNPSSTGFFATKMFCNGPSFLSAAVMYENYVVAGNNGQVKDDNGKLCHLAEPVVAIYPSEGTFYSDHPFVIPQASWVTPAKKAAAQVFRDFLLSTPQQQKALQYGFRPANLSVKVGAPIDAAHGVDPRPVQAVLNVPSADVVQAVETSWKSLRRKVDVMLILDRSGSMNDNGKIGAARQGLLQFVSMLGDLDGLGLTVFNDTINVLSPVVPLGPNRQKIRDQINAITACCNTLLYDTIDQQVKALAALPNDRHIKVVVVLTDGMDDASTLTRDQLINDIAARGLNAGNGIKVFAIAYGSDADVQDLQAIAGATGGQEYAGTPQNIQQVYLQISSFF